MSINLEHPPISELEQLKPKAYIERALNQRSLAINCLRTYHKIISGAYDIPTDQFVELLDQIDIQSQGAHFNSSLCQMSDTKITYTHDNEFVSDTGNLRATRGMYLNFFLEQIIPGLNQSTEVICIIPDKGLSDRFYNHGPDLWKQILVDFHADQIAGGMKTDSRLIFAVVNENIAEGGGTYMIDRYADVMGHRPLAVAPELQALI